MKNNSYGKEQIFAILEQAISTHQENFKFQILIKNLKLECHGMIFASKFQEGVFMI